MTKVIFLHNLVYEHMGPMYLSAILKRNNHDCDVFIQGYDGDIVEKTIEAKPDLVAFSCTTGQHKWASKIAKKIKEKYQVLIMMGGPHPTYFPEVINDSNIDIICRGEGEYAFLELANALRDKKNITRIKNLWVKKGGKIYKNNLRPLNQNLDELPFPDRTLYYAKYNFLKKNPRKSFLTTRGCPFDCTFCHNHSLKKIYGDKRHYVRRRSVEKVIEEILEVKSKYPLEVVYLMDDTFILDHAWVKKFLKLYKEKVKLPFTCLVRAGLITGDLIKKMSLAGCKRTFFSIETGNEHLRNKILKKGITNKQIIYAAKLMKKYKIKFKGYNMLGLPGETLEDAFLTIKLNRKIKTDYPVCTILQPYPQTELYEYLLKNGYLGESFSPDGFTQSYFGLNQQMKVKEEILNLHKFFFYAVKFPWLDPIIKQLIKLPPNKMFDFIFLTGFAYIHIGSEKQNILRTLWFGIKSSINFFFHKD